ncbi:MAG: glycosyltransferase family 4 protein [Bryobacteraceae bacterium]
MRIRFLTSTPLNVVEGSGTFAGIATLGRALTTQGVEVDIVSPQFTFPVHTIRRLLFNEQLWWKRRGDYDLTVGFDMDGYRIAAHRDTPHVASVKGVIADEMRFERGMTRLTMSVQAACERAHVRAAGLVITTSRYAARRIQELYGLSQTPSVVPELIDLEGWRGLFARNPVEPDAAKFTVFCVCRFYPRKRLDVLLDAAARLRDSIPGLEIRIAGGGPEWARLQTLWKTKNLERTVRWLGDISQDELAREYRRCDILCLPSVQEGFGIVFLEAMAAGKPIVATLAAAVPEVVESGVLVEPGNAEALAEGILGLYRSPERRAELSAAGLDTVLRYDSPHVAKLFLAEISRLV